MPRKKAEKVELKEAELSEKISTLENAYGELTKTVIEMRKEINEVKDAVNTITKAFEELFKAGEGKEGMNLKGMSFKDLFMMWILKEFSGSGKDAVKVAESLFKAYTAGQRDAYKSFGLALRIVTKPKLLDKLLKEEEKEEEEEEE